MSYDARGMLVSVTLAIASLIFGVVIDHFGYGGNGIPSPDMWGVIGTYAVLMVIFIYYAVREERSGG